MFNLRRILRFWGRFWATLIPLLLLWVVLILTALQVRGELEGVWWTGLKLAGGLALLAMAILAAFALAIPFMQRLYALKSRREIFWYLIHRLFGQANFRPYILIEEARINPQISDPDSLIVKVGGPGNMVIRKDSAVVLEKAGRLSRVEGPGFPRLEPFERVYDTIDLRPRRWQYPVVAMSKEGIQVTCETDVIMQIQDGGQAPTGQRPFPMDPGAVFVAATSKWIREAHRAEGDRVLDWKGLIVVSAAEGTLRSILSRYPLDRLIGPESPEQEHPRRIICQELEEALHSAASRVGAKVLKVELGKIQVADEVTRQWIENWQAAWKRWETEYLATGEAAYTEAVGTARSEAMAKRIVHTTNILHALHQKSYEAFVAGAKLQLQLAMRNIGSDSLALTYMPREAIKLLQATANLPPPLEAE